VKILFVCTCNLNRSPTFEHYFKKNYPNHEVKSCGTCYGYPDRLSEKILDWANVVYVMDYSHKLFIQKQFPKKVWKVKVIGISDEYDPDEERLIELIDYWIKDSGFR